MSVETFDTETPLRVTPSAAAHFLASLKGSGKQAIRISVEESGCTGFKYVMQEVDEAVADDASIDLDNGVRLLIAGDAVQFLRGTEVDLVREGINKVLRFHNPNVVAECGCGESFSVA